MLKASELRPSMEVRYVGSNDDWKQVKSNDRLYEGRFAVRFWDGTAYYYERGWYEDTPKWEVKDAESERVESRDASQE